MAIRFDDLPDEAPAPAQSMAAAVPQGGLSFDDLPDEPQAAAPATTGEPWNLNDMMPDSWQPALRQLDDYGLSLSKGIIGAAEGVAGVGDIATGGRVTPGLKAAYGYDPAGRRAALDQQATPEHQQAMQEMDRAKGFGATLQALRDNPSLLGHAITESLPGMALGGLAGRGVALGAKALGAAPGMAGMIGAGAGEGLLSAGQQASQVTQQTGGLSPGQTALAVGTGAATGLLGAAGAKIGRALGIGDVDAMLAGQNGSSIARNLVQRALGGTTLESLEEAGQSTSEQVLGNIALGKDPFDGVAKAATMGGVTGGVMGGGANLLARPNANNQVEQPPAAPVAAPQAEAMPTPAPAAPPVPPQPQPAPQPVPKTPFAGSQDVAPLFRSMGMDDQQMNNSLALLRPDEPSIEAARRGKMTWEETSQLADLAGTTVAKMRARRLGQPLNAEDHLAATRFLQQQTTKTLDLANQMSELTNAGKSDDALAANFMTALNDLRTVQGAVMGSRAELGRAMAIQRMNVQTGKQATALLDSVGGIESAKDMAKALVTAARVGGVKSANKLATKAGTDLFWTYYKAALLSGPETHIVNSASNLANALLNIPTRGAAGVIGSAKRSVGLQGETYIAEPGYQIRGFVDGISNGVRAFADSWQGRETELEASSNAKNDVYRSDLLGQKYWGVPLRALGAADAFFKAINAGMETYSLAYRTAASEGLEGDALGARVKELVANPTEKMKAGIKATAEFQTFTDKSGPIINMLNSARNRIPLGAGNIVAPFFKTPGKIVAYSAKHTPGLTYIFKDSREAWAQGGARHEEVLARQAVGALIMSLGAMGSAAGVLTGNGPSDEEKRRAWLAAGNQPLSLKINGQWWSYGRIEPFATLLGVSADVYQNYQSGDTGVAAFTKALSSNILSKSWLKGLTSAIQAIADPDRYGAQWVAGTGATLIDPWTIGAHAARAGDQYQRATDRGSITDQLKYRLPFLRETLPIRYDQFGAPMLENERQAFGIGPITHIKASDDPVRVEANRLGWSPRGMKRKFSLKSNVPGQPNQQVDLTLEQVNELNELANSRMHAVASALVRSKDWQVMDDEERVEALAGVLSKSRSSAKVAFAPFVRNGSRGMIELHRKQTAALAARGKK